ncbi:MAG: hypothetical protein NC299_00785 [Lachnospiraceae bacterium]|nr:hypothetical protein [Lachnospiraceae bacterium]
MKYFLSTVAVLAAVFLITKPGVVTAAVGAAVSDCLEVIVPSLFAFAVLAAYLQRSGLYRTALRPLTLPLSKLLRIDEELCAVFVLANVGGYPVGASLLAELTRRGALSEKDAGRMLCCCFGSGPSFVVGIVGMRVFGSAAAGAALFAVGFLSSLIMALLVRAGGGIALKRSEARCDLSAGAFISSVTAGARGMFTVCAMITGFSVVSAMLNEIGVNALFERLFGLLGAGENSGEIFAALLEVTRIKSIAPTNGSVIACAALLSFGGACVIMQVAALAGKIPLKKFVLSRVGAALLSGLLAVPLSGLLPPADVQTFLTNGSTEPFTKNAALSGCVLVMCGILLLEARRDKG